MVLLISTSVLIMMIEPPTSAGRGAACCQPLCHPPSPCGCVCAGRYSTPASASLPRALSACLSLRLCLSRALSASLPVCLSASRPLRLSAWYDCAGRLRAGRCGCRSSQCCRVAACPSTAAARAAPPPAATATSLCVPPYPDSRICFKGAAARRVIVLYATARCLPSPRQHGVSRARAV
jgi:hypothetical protein